MSLVRIRFYSEQERKHTVRFGMVKIRYGTDTVRRQIRWMYIQNLILIKTVLLNYTFLKTRFFEK